MKRNNIKSSLLDSEILMAEVLNKKREYILLHSKKKLNPLDLNYFKYMINERTYGKPIAYLIGKKFFWKNEFIVNKNVLIPRPDTEIIIEETLKLTKNKSNLNVLEIGVGSGCILLSVLNEKKGFSGTGIDISSKCLNVCKNNINKLLLKNKIRL